MKIQNGLKTLAKSLNGGLYIVGGYVRNFLIDKSLSLDVDVASPISEEIVADAVVKIGGEILATYKRTGTLLFKLEGQKYEYTRFRKDCYEKGGKHLPNSVEFTDDILEDALRRDFKCNAVYYDVLNEEIVDVLGGVEDIKNKVLDTVKAPKEVFSHDGLRLMRLARFTGELNFTPTEQTLASAKEFADNILDVSPERILEELKKILVADKKYPFSSDRGHYLALKVLGDTRVLDKILPELTLGRGMEQRKDYHNYDVLEHVLRTVLYADQSVRLYALLHDIGKPFAMLKTGRYHSHDLYGKEIVKKVLTRLKADNKTIEKAVRLTALHMLDMDLKTSEKKVVKRIVENADIFKELLLLKQADFSGCKDDLSICPTVNKWQEIYTRAKEQGVPFSLKDLRISASDLTTLGFGGREIGKMLKTLFDRAVLSPEINDRDRLLQLADNLKK